MAGAFAYRGPDDDGFRIHDFYESSGRSESVGLGHKRLAIIDLSEAGRQPMCNEDQSLWLSFNGEIYNHQELRQELTAKGHQFRSQTDSELILHLYEEEGTGAVQRMNGMFAFALWDDRYRRLWLCRDRLGIKPLVYYWDGQVFAFASEIKALVKNPAVRREIEPRALMLYLTFNYVPAPLTIFKMIRKLEPGHWLLIEKGDISTQKYWEVPSLTKEASNGNLLPGSVRDCQQKLMNLLRRSVGDRMIADVPLGAFLSGGIDSSIIVALMARQSGSAVKTFSIGFTEDKLFDETRYALQVAQLYRTDHHEFKISHADILDVLVEVLDSFDEPFADSSAIPTFIISREARKHVKVVLSGDGGDELFAGYRCYLAEYWLHKYRAVPALLRKGFFEKFVEFLPDSRDHALGEFVRRAKKFIRGTQGSFAQRVLALKEVVPFAIRQNLLAPSYCGGHTNGSDESLAWIARFLDPFDGDRINSILYYDLKDSLPGDMLTKVDWMSMQNSLEVRVPFLDHRVVELAFGIPGARKLRRGVTKYFLKETFRDLLPKSLYRRPKAGFEIPIGRWLRGELKFLVDNYLNQERICDQGIFNFDVVDKLVQDHMQRRSDTSWMLWNLIVFQHWYSRYFI